MEVLCGLNGLHVSSTKNLWARFAYMQNIVLVDVSAADVRHDRRTATEKSENYISLMMFPTTREDGTRSAVEVHCSWGIILVLYMLVLQLSGRQTVFYNKIEVMFWWVEKLCLGVATVVLSHALLTTNQSTTCRRSVWKNLLLMRRRRFKDAARIWH